MSAIAKLPYASSKPTKTFEEGGVKTATSDRGLVISMVHTVPPIDTPPKYSSIGDLVKRWEQDPERSAHLKEARQWVADTFHADEKDTIRILRLRKGLSQAQLAKVINTSQPHIARIERGTENVHIDTCRRLCNALDIDMNTLNRALAQQEALARLKAKS